MKTTVNKFELKEMDACGQGYKTFVEAHGDKTVTLSQALDSNGWDDIWWLISNAYEKFSDEQKHDLRVYGCNKALINIEKIKPYCSDEEYKIIVDYLNNPNESAESARSAAWSAAGSAALSAAESAACSAACSAAWSAACSAARPAESAACSAACSAARSAESAEMKEFTEELKQLFINWENQ